MTAIYFHYLHLFSWHAWWRAVPWYTWTVPWYDWSVPWWYAWTVPWWYAWSVPSHSQRSILLTWPMVRSLLPQMQILVFWPCHRGKRYICRAWLLGAEENLLKCLHSWQNKIDIKTVPTSVVFHQLKDAPVPVSTSRYKTLCLSEGDFTQIIRIFAEKYLEWTPSWDSFYVNFELMHTHDSILQCTHSVVWDVLYHLRLLLT